MTVNPATATLSFGNLVSTYNGQPQVATVITDPANLSGVTIAYAFERRDRLATDDGRQVHRDGFADQCGLHRGQHHRDLHHQSGQANRHLGETIRHHFGHQVGPGPARRDGQCPGHIPVHATRRDVLERGDQPGPPGPLQPHRRGRLRPRHRFHDDQRPTVVTSFVLLAADDTGILGDGVTANHQPEFVGKADPGSSVTLYAVVNGQLSAPQLVASASPVDGSFTFQFPGSLPDINIQLVAQATDGVGNTGPLSSALSVRIITVAGDYTDSGTAQFAVFVPTTESYIVKNVTNLQVDVTPGRDIPVQYDFNGDGKTDLTAYRFNAAQYYGFLSNGAVTSYAFGNGNLSLPVSGYYDSSGTFDYALYNSTTATWAVNLPRPGGEVINFGVPKVDIPVPAAYDGGGVTEIATFRPSTVYGNDADSFNVLSSNFVNNYQVSFTDPAVIAKGFVYKAGDIPAPADYDGIGKDEFAIYRPSTGQFFILKVPNLFDKSTWTLRTVSLNLPGGPQLTDEPASEDYEGTGKASPTVYRPTNSTFYEISTVTGSQQTVPLGAVGDVAAAGPLIYRLSALFGSFSSSGGYPVFASKGGVNLGSIDAASGGAQADAVTASTTSIGAGTSRVDASMIASATLASRVNTGPTVATPPSTPPVPSIPINSGVVTLATQATSHPVTVGVTTPRSPVKARAGSSSEVHAALTRSVTDEAKLADLASSEPTKVETVTPLPSSHTQPDQRQAAVAAVLMNLGPINFHRMAPTRRGQPSPR